MPVRRPALILALVLALVLAPALLGAGPPGDAVVVVKKTLDAALAIARAGGTRDENLAALRAVARDILDTRAMGRRAMGDVLAAQPRGQQEEYLELFDEVIVRAYLQKLLLFRNPRFSYGEPRRRDDVLIVPSTIATTKDEYHVDYEMREREGRWVATDVIVEGISLTDNYKEQFSALLRDRSFVELLELMRKKVRPVREGPT
jgi:phospholipid transport system substrate-binding protein